MPKEQRKKRDKVNNNHHDTAKSTKKSKLLEQEVVVSEEPSTSKKASEGAHKEEDDGCQDSSNVSSAADEDQEPSPVKKKKNPLLTDMLEDQVKCLKQKLTEVATQAHNYRMELHAKGLENGTLSRELQKKEDTIAKLLEDQKQMMDMQSQIEEANLQYYRTNIELEIAFDEKYAAAQSEIASLKKEKDDLVKSIELMDAKMEEYKAEAIEFCEECHVKSQEKIFEIESICEQKLEQQKVEYEQLILEKEKTITARETIIREVKATCQNKDKIIEDQRFRINKIERVLNERMNMGQPTVEVEPMARLTPALSKREKNSSQEVVQQSVRGDQNSNGQSSQSGQISGNTNASNNNRPSRKRRHVTAFQLSQNRSNAKNSRNNSEESSSADDTDYSYWTPTARAQRFRFKAPNPPSAEAARMMSNEANIVVPETSDTDNGRDRAENEPPSH